MKRDFLILLLVFLLSNLVYAALQKPNNVQPDSRNYLQMADSICRGTRITARAPFVRRIGVPLLASVTHKFSHLNLERSFQVVNLVGNVLLITLFGYWLFLHINAPDIRILLVVLYCFSWISPIRQVNWWYINIDTWGPLCLLAGLIVIESIGTMPRGRFIILLSLLTFLGVFVRETMLVIPACLLFVHNPIIIKHGLVTFKEIHKRLPSIVYLIPILAGIVAWKTVGLLINPVNPSYSYSSSALTWAYSNPLPIYVLGWFLAFGPISIFLLFAIKTAITYLYKHQHLLIFFLAFAVLAFIGGNSPMRLLQWLAPVYYVLIGVVLERHRQVIYTRAILVMVGVPWLLSQRVFFLYPNGIYPTSKLAVFTPLGSRVFFMDLFAVSEHGNRVLQALQLIQFLALTLIVLAYLAYKSDRCRSASNGGTESAVRDERS